MSESFRRLTADPDFVRAQHITYSVRLVSDIAAHYNETLDVLDMLKASCMLDAFYVHIRLLTEFLTHNDGKRDFRPKDFGVSWTAPPGEAVDRLGDAWDIASKYVVHFGKHRLPSEEDARGDFTVSSEYFRQLAGDALGVYTSFVDAVEATAPPWTKGSFIPDRHRAPEDWAARVQSDVVGELRDAQRYGERTLGVPGAKPLPPVRGSRP